MNNRTTFKPYIASENVSEEMTVTSIILGIILAVVFASANLYLGLRVGLNTSNSIPSAVISMGVIRFILKRNSILENNIVQTIGSAGTCVTTGCMITLPAPFLWVQEWGTSPPSILEITVICLCSSFLSVAIMVPLRRALIVQQYGVLLFPEGVACAEVLLAGDKAGDKADSSSNTIFYGLGISAAYEFTSNGLGLFPSEFQRDIPFYKGSAFGASTHPALIGVGYICGPKITVLLFGGGLLTWFVFIPCLALFGADSVIFPATVPVSQMTSNDIWANYIRYIGAGALACGGILTLLKTIPLIAGTFKSALKHLSTSKTQTLPRTQRDLDLKLVGIIIALALLAIWILPIVDVNFFGVILILIFGFFFSVVSCWVVGMIGDSNNPVSGMTIASLLAITYCFRIMGQTSHATMVSTIVMGAFIAIIISIAGDAAQDLNTGYIIGATPQKQEIGELIGALAASCVIGSVLYLLNNAWGFGSTELPAPQAMLMRVVVTGVLEGNIPWILVFIGAFVAIILEMFGIPSIAVSLGIYLPITTSAGTMLGGLVRLIVEKIHCKSQKQKEQMINSGVLYSSGFIAGEGIVGIIIALLALIPFGNGTLENFIDISNYFNLGLAGAIVIGLLLLASIVYFAYKGRNNGLNERDFNIASYDD